MSSASVQFITGYNYEDKQIFIVLHNDDGRPEGTHYNTINHRKMKVFNAKTDQLLTSCFRIRSSKRSGPYNYIL